MAGHWHLRSTPGDSREKPAFMNKADRDLGYAARAVGTVPLPRTPADRMRDDMSPIVPPERVEEILEPFGGVDAVVEGLRLAEANRRYVEAHREELEQRYPDEWIGVLHQTVVAHGHDAQKVKQGVIDAGGNPHSVFLELLTTEEQTWIL